MRKQDYATLAAIIRAVRNHNMDIRTAKPIKPDAVVAAENIAIEFSRLANVDKVAFLKACGIET